MDKVIISTKKDNAQQVVKEARKKAIDEGLTFSDAIIKLLEKWLQDEVRITKEVRK